MVEFRPRASGRCQGGRYGVGALSEIVDRVAKAIHADRSIGREWESEAPTMREFYTLCAKSAIEAMREPTIAMLNAAGYVDPERLSVCMGRVDWVRMIDEALKE